MKKLLAVLLSLAMLTGVLTGCGGNDSGTKAGSEQDGKQANSGETANVKHKSSLIIGTDADINNLDLQEQQDQINNIVLKNTHQTLVFFNNGSAGKDRFVP